MEAASSEEERRPLLREATPRGDYGARGTTSGAEIPCSLSPPNSRAASPRSPGQRRLHSSLRVPSGTIRTSGFRDRADDDSSELVTKQKSTRSAFWARLNNLWRGPVVDSMTYKAEVLTSWNTLFNLQGVTTAFDSRSAWQMVGRLLLFSLCIAVIMVVLVPNPAQMKTSKFQKIAIFLRVFVGLLLGFFLTSSVNRWFECTKGFLELYDAIRNLQMQLLALGVPSDTRNTVVRYAVVSGWLLGMTLQIEAMHSDEEKEIAVVEMYDSLREDKEPAEASRRRSSGPSSPQKVVHVVDPSARYTILEEEEISILKGMADPASMMWIWVASLVGRMAQDGWIPPMQSPTYGLVTSIVQEAHVAIRNVRQSVLVQAPFIYVHMLACLVHVNNIVNAISFGIVVGSTVGTTLQHYRASPMYKEASREKDLVRDWENLLISFVICVIGPFLYHVLLEVSIHIAQPFESGQSEIPTDRLMEKLQRDLADGERMASSVPHWQAPFFKERPPPPPPPPPPAAAEDP